MIFYSQTTSKGVKKIDAEAKKDEKKEPKYPTGMEKIVDMPLIASNNLISVMQRNESTMELNAKDKTFEVNEASAERTLEMGKSEKKTASIARSPAIKKTDNEKPKVAPQPVQNGTTMEYDFSSRLGKRTDLLEKGIELTLTPLSKNDTEESAESDRSMIQRKDAGKIVETSESRKVEGEASPIEKKFTFEESRELAGEPDGKADEEEVTEPPALPRSPLPIESRPPLQGDTRKPVVATEPRPSFLHGAVHAESKVKPVVPQKPINFLTKSPAAIPDGNGPTKKSYVLPPPSVQNAVNRPAQTIGKAFIFQSPDIRLVSAISVKVNCDRSVGRCH